MLHTVPTLRRICAAIFALPILFAASPQTYPAVESGAVDVLRARVLGAGVVCRGQRFCGYVRAGRRWLRRMRCSGRAVYRDLGRVRRGDGGMA